MVIIMGILLIIWGVLVLYSSLFKMKEGDYKEKSYIGVSGFIELEFLFRLLSRLPSGVIKGVTLLTGISFIALGLFIII